MQSIKFIINNHDIKVLQNTADNKESCNCRNKNNCPLDGKCLTTSKTYKAQITLSQLNQKQKISQEPPKQILNSLEHYENDTELSKENWTIKRNYFTPNVTCRIIKKCAPFNVTKRNCYLCLNEQLETASCKGDNLLKKGLDLFNNCRHQSKFTLLRHDIKD